MRAERGSKVGERPQRWQYRYGWKKRWSVLRANAKRRGIEFDPAITPEVICDMTKADECHYCGGSLPYNGSGIDRKDNALGYVAGNLVACCKFCNDAKGPWLTHDEFARVMSGRVQQLGWGHVWDGIEWRHSARKV